MKVKTDIITSMAESPIGQPVILLKMYAKTFKNECYLY